MYLKDAPRLERDGDKTRIVIPVHSFKDVPELNKFIEDASAIWADGKEDLQFSLTIEKAKKRRSLNANAYYWQLLNKVALEMNLPATEAHNLNLAQIGIPWLVGGERAWVLQPDTDWWRELINFHFAPSDMTDTDDAGEVKRWFYLLKPSHLMDRQEMSVLINKTVEDAKALGIETLTPDELNRMLSTWKGDLNDGIQ